MAFSSLYIVRPGEQVFAARKRLALEICTQSIGKYRDIQFVRNLTQLKYLFFAEELRFVDQHAMQW